MSSKHRTRSGIVAAALALALLARPSGAGAAEGPSVDQCLADHVAGQEDRLESRLVAARERFRGCAHASCPRPVAQACADFLREIEPRVPSVVLVVRDPAGRDVVDGELRLDGEAVPSEAWGKARELDPGSHALTFARGGQTLARQTVVVSEGEKERRVQLTVDAAGEAPATGVDPLRVAGWIGVGLGVAALGSAVGFGVSASRDYQALEGSCAPNCSDDQIGAVRAKALATDVLLGSGIALAVAGGVMLLVPRGGGTRTQAMAVPYVLPAGRGAGVGIVVTAF